MKRDETTNYKKYSVQKRSFSAVSKELESTAPHWVANSSHRVLPFSFLHISLYVDPFKVRQGKKKNRVLSLRSRALREMLEKSMVWYTDSEDEIASRSYGCRKNSRSSKRMMTVGISSCYEEGFQLISKKLWNLPSLVTPHACQLYECTIPWIAPHKKRNKCQKETKSTSEQWRRQVNAEKDQTWPRKKRKEERQNNIYFIAQSARSPRHA